MAQFHNLLSKCDRALLAFIVARGAGTLDDVVSAKRSQDRDLPVTICYSESAEEAAPYSGTYAVKAAIIVRTQAPSESGDGPTDRKLDSDLRVAQTFDLFHTNIDSAGDKLADDITAAARALGIANPKDYGDLADFTMLDIAIKGIEAGFEEGSVTWTDTLNLLLVACPSNVSET